jgi:hypothetical protein
MASVHPPQDAQAVYLRGKIFAWENFPPSKIAV